ncbi:MAG: serine acetyltransferase [Candidatus Wallbacteria bacterium HGW-Wallbacteria-1]|jgi:serine O-acetyltransferase|uniref:Serine acetyltransferase n=1 Tax=Candidatus Wallbacteria bacterium HGW-Wallbacteria-1 TaxID=2013854 RepID=A0A2N1PPH0_9BACT|nr:MAG: serine acetyltransferase [Candidatus Wallbacteria bacterium HGW-Wallbacteria-1]
MPNNEEKECKSYFSDRMKLKRELTPIVNTIVASCQKRDCLNHLDAGAIPSRTEIVRILRHLSEIAYPGYHVDGELEEATLPYHIGSLINQCFDDMAHQIEKAYRHECQRNVLECVNCQLKSLDTTSRFFAELPNLREILREDIEAAFAGDPAAKSLDEIVICYPGVMAITVYRFAHSLNLLGVPLIPRIMTEYAHSVSGVDIHPGAKVGRRFFIDHGTGVVIGETCVIGNDVKIYQGVTLGAKSFPRDSAGNLLRDTKRHPTIEDGVTIYSNAIILGGDVTIGANSTIGGNTWVTESVPPDTVVMVEPPKLTFKTKARKSCQGCIG